MIWNSEIKINNSFLYYHNGGGGGADCSGGDYPGILRSKSANGFNDWGNESITPTLSFLKTLIFDVYLLFVEVIGMK